MRSNPFVKNLLKVCRQAKAVAISGHQNPDYDAIGSSLALREILRQNGIVADILLEQPLDNAFQNFVSDTEFVTEVECEYDVLITVDTAEPKLLPSVALGVLQSAQVTFNIDHHYGNSLYANYNFVEGERSSACETLYYLFAGRFSLNQFLAKCLYIGIYTDTGGFVYSNAQSATFECLSGLLSVGLDADKLLRECFREKSVAAMEITRRAFASLKFYYDNQILVSVLHESDFSETGATLNESKFIVSYLPTVAGVKVGISVSEPVKGDYHVSLRTAMDDVDVSQIAIRFGGGGHKRASGLTLKGELDKALNALIKQTISILEKEN